MHPIRMFVLLHYCG